MKLKTYWNGINGCIYKMQWQEPSSQDWDELDQSETLPSIMNLVICSSVFIRSKLGSDEISTKVLVLKIY